MPNDQHIDESDAPLPRNGNVLSWRVGALEEWRGDTGKAITDHGERLTAAEGNIRSHDETSKRIESKLDSTNNWLRGIAGSLVLALALLIANLIFPHSQQAIHVQP